MDGNSRTKHKSSHSSVLTGRMTTLATSRFIVHCPADILKLIFETIPGRHNDPGRNLKQAISLSAVCRTWRMVALDTPKIWSDIRLQMGPNNSGWEEYWTHAVERVKKVPIKIQIHNLCIERPNDLSRVIQAASLTIDTLHLNFEHADDINSLAKIWENSAST